MRAAQRLSEKTKDIEVPEPTHSTAGDPFRPRTAPGGALAFQSAMREKQAEIDAMSAELAELRAQKQSGSPSGVEIPLDQLYEVAGRRRYMPPAKFVELRENLRRNKLIQLVVILPRAEGGYEIQSGHHRVDAYRELGRSTIRCVLGDATGEEADDGAFWANLMQSDLTDYEKYIGLTRIHAKHPELSQAELGERVGISSSHINALLSFSRLPEQARAILEANKAIMGANAAAELATIAETGKADRVVEAVRRLAECELDQTQAVKYAKAVDTPKATKAVAESYKVKTGKSTWCDVRKTKNIMRIEFQSEAVADAVQEAIKQHLEALASKS
jgi:ParB family transcriptional regulator, chromosome partitioning protein